MLDTRITTKRVTNVAYLVSLATSIGPGEATDFERELVGLIGRGGREIVIDLSDVGTVDPTAVDVLVRAGACVREIGGELVLASRDGHGDYVLKILDPTDPGAARGLHGGLDRALAVWSRHADDRRRSRTRQLLRGGA